MTQDLLYSTGNYTQCFVISYKGNTATVFPVVVYGCETWTIKKAARGIVSSVYSLPQARILDWVAIPFSRGSSQPRD